MGSSLAFPLIDLFGGGAEQPATNLTMTAADLEKDVKENPQDDTLYVACLLYTSTFLYYLLVLNFRSFFNMNY